MSQAGMLAFPFGEYRVTEQVLLAQCQREVYAKSERLEQFTDRTNSGYERLLYVHEDLQGNTRYYTKDNGQSFAELTYDAWGMPESPNKLLNNDHGNYVYATYTGHIFDTTLDIYFAEARFYDAQTRQWLALDPIKDGGNWYQYCYSNPLRYWDPLGEMPEIYSQFIKFGCGFMDQSVADPRTQLIQTWLRFQGGTISQGITGSIGGGVFGSYNLGTTLDGYNVASQLSLAAGGGTLNLSLISGYVMYTNAPNVDSLTGRSYQVGGSASAGIAVGIEVVVFNDSETGEMYTGIAMSGGVGTLWAEVHGEVGNTWDIQDIYSNLMKKIYNFILPQ